MIPAAVEAVVRPEIQPITREQALRTYQQRIADMTDEQLTEERHRLESQLPYGEPWRMANAEFDRRHPFRRAMDKGVLL